MSTLDIKIQNNSKIKSSEVFIGFWGDQLNATINGNPMEPIEKDKWYKLSEINSFVMESVTSGRLYVAYYDTFSPVNGGQGLPSIVAPNSPAYHKRFDKIELTFDGTVYGVADLTAIDYWSVPMSLETEKDGRKVASLDGVKSGYTVNEIYTNLVKLSNPVQSTATAKELIKEFKDAGHSLPPDIQDQLLNPPPALVETKKGKFVRIIGPQTYPSFGDPATDQVPGLPFTPYNTFMEYFQYLINTFGPGKTPPPPLTKLGEGKIAHIAGHYGGSAVHCGPPCESQNYNLWASIDNNFNLTIEGTCDKIPGKTTMTITKWNLLDPPSSYGGNPLFSLNGGEPQYPQNNIYAWILGDFFAGLQIGAIGSGAEVDGKIVGDMTSSEWFSILPQAGYLFDKLWGTGVTNHWNQWAQVLNPRSDAYNFAYSERFSAPQISINPNIVDTLKLILLDADVTT